MRAWVSMLVLVAGCAATPASGGDAAEPAALVAVGREVAEAQCGACHALDRAAGASPRPMAPNFADLASRYRLDVLAEELHAGVHVGAPEMPKFDLSVREVDALVAYVAAQSD